MEFKVNDISQSEKEVEVTLSYDEIRSEIEGEVKKEASKIQVPGIRKGKVPKQIIKQRFGDTLEFEASEKVANSRFWQLAKENNLRPIGQPVMTDLDFNIEKDFKFKVKYEVLFEIDGKDYTGQLIEVPDLQVKSDEVEKEIDNLLRSNSNQEDADAIGDDDNFLLGVELTRTDESGQPAADSKPEKMQIDLSNQNVHPDIKANSRGKKVGEKFRNERYRKIPCGGCPGVPAALFRAPGRRGEPPPGGTRPGFLPARPRRGDRLAVPVPGQDGPHRLLVHLVLAVFRGTHVPSRHVRRARRRGGPPLSTRTRKPTCPRSGSRSCGRS